MSTDYLLGGNVKTVQNDLENKLGEFVDFKGEQSSKCGKNNSGFDSQNQVVKLEQLRDKLVILKGEIENLFYELRNSNLDDRYCSVLRKGEKEFDNMQRGYDEDMENCNRILEHFKNKTRQWYFYLS